MRTTARSFFGSVAAISPLHEPPLRVTVTNCVRASSTTWYAVTR
jgi:hypothetical protein